MTLFDTRSEPVEATAEVVWSAPDTNLWVATINGDYAGMIEFTDGHFVVRDHAASVIATCSSIPAAQNALASHAPSAQAKAHEALSHAIAALAPSATRPLFGRTHRPGYLRGTAARA